MGNSSVLSILEIIRRVVPRPRNGESARRGRDRKSKGGKYRHSCGVDIEQGEGGYSIRNDGNRAQGEGLAEQRSATIGSVLNGPGDSGHHSSDRISETSTHANRDRGEEAAHRLSSETVTYGTLRHAGNSWILDDLAPHVTIKLKRWFSRIDVAAKTLRLSSNTENSAELEWFCERFPLQMSQVDAERLTGLAESHRDLQEKIHGTLNGQYERLQLAMAIPPRDYQDQAAELCYRSGGLLCADELGLGKTVEGIALLARGGALPAVVVVPPNLLSQWEEKLEEFLPSAKVCTIRVNPSKESGRARERRAVADIVLISYSRLRSWTDQLHPRSLILDEVHELRHSGTNKYLAACEVRSRSTYCMGLSATPIYNYGGEFYNVLGIIQPGALGERAEFLREWCGEGGSDKPKISDPKAFGAWIREQGLMLRRSRIEVGRELPPVVRCIFDIEIGDNSCGEIEGLAWEAIYGPPRSRFVARGELDHKLRQWTGVAKAPGVASFVDELLESSGEPVLLAGWHYAVYDIWKKNLNRWCPVFYTGLQNKKEKDAAIHGFKNGESRLLIMSLRSGQGFDGLQKVCKRVVYGELDWAPNVHQQLTGRLHRDGQGEPTMEYWPVASEGSDPIIMDTLGVKRWQSDGVIDPDGHRLLEVQSDPNAIRRLAEDYLRRRGKDPKKPPENYSRLNIP